MCVWDIILLKALKLNLPKIAQTIYAGKTLIAALKYKTEGSVIKLCVMLFHLFFKFVGGLVSLFMCGGMGRMLGSDPNLCSILEVYLNKVKKAFSNEWHSGNYGNYVTMAVTKKDPFSHIYITIYNEICLLA